LKYSQAFIPTLKEDPSEAELASHALTLRAGLIRKIASGIYAFLPAGTRVLRKIENIVREEMDRAGAMELFLPVMQPSDLWQKSGRWDQYGPELFRLRDRNDRQFCLGPTHEEIMTHLAYLDLKSYKDLPINLYQIQVKFRDEIRPRYGLLRGREFIMKDAYSFCEDEKDLDQIYQKMHQAYSRIVERLGLEFRVVEADTGLIGGKSSHEFLVLAGEGEETLVYCPECGYAANIELAGTACPEPDAGNEKDIQEINTPGVTDIESLARFMGVDRQRTAKTMLLEDEDRNIYAFMMTGDRELNISKAEKFLKRPLQLFEGGKRSLVIGYVGPVGLDPGIKVYADNSLKGIKNIITGANKNDTHLKNVSMERDADIASYGDFTYPGPEDRCIRCGSGINREKGIEIGHIFKLGSKYSQKMEASFLGRDGRQKPFIMGCYGIGITRILSAVVEQLHDEKGIIWPPSIAPYTVSLVVTTSKSGEMADAGESIYKQLTENGIEVLYDDRNISAGIKFKDSDLLGLPIRMVVGKKFLEKKMVEVQLRRTGEARDMPPEGLSGFVKEFLAENIIG